MSKHNLIQPPVDEIDEDSAPYAEVMMLDEGGVDLKLDGETLISASFEGIDPFQLAYEVLPESFTFRDTEERDDWHALVEEVCKVTGVPTDLNDVDLELAARAFLTALARRNGYEKP